MENSPFSKADFISAGSSSMSSIYTGIHLEKFVRLVMKK
jgi:hypothetical protein